MYTMTEVCKITGLSYETLKFYCNQGLIPDLQRTANNRRVFTEYQVKLIFGILCLKDCDMSIQEMKVYLQELFRKDPDIPFLKDMLAKKREQLLQEQARIERSLDFIRWKQQFYDEVLAGTKKLSDAMDAAHPQHQKVPMV